VIIYLIGLIVCAFGGYLVGLWDTHGYYADLED
jgi:hypothetical protein